MQPTICSSSGCGSNINVEALWSPLDPELFRGRFIRAYVCIAGQFQTQWPKLSFTFMRPQLWWMAPVRFACPPPPPPRATNSNFIDPLYSTPQRDRHAAEEPCTDEQSGSVDTCVDVIQLERSSSSLNDKASAFAYKARRFDPR